MIPKIIHQLWDSPEGKPVPVRFQILAETFKRLNPAWDTVCGGAMRCSD